MNSSDSSSGQLSIYAPDSSLANPRFQPTRVQFDLLKPGDVFGGNYKILSYLSSGSMGIIYKARHVSLDAEYAIKTISTEELDETAILRFKNEAQAIARLQHPNIVGLHYFDFHKEKIPYYVMEFLDGEDLGTTIKKHGAMAASAVLPLFIDVCAGLGYAHRKGMLHRDVKPANFFVLRSPDKAGSCLKIIDFGIVKFLEGWLPESQGLTAIGAVCGSPGYMSPECSGGKPLDERSDIYSLGCALFEALTGNIPFRGRTTRETMMLHHQEAVPALTTEAPGRTFPDGLQTVVAKMLAKLPEARYQTMDEVARDLKNVLDNRPLGTPQIIELNLGTASGSFDTICLPSLLTQVCEYRLSQPGESYLPEQESSTVLLPIEPDLRQRSRAKISFYLKLVLLILVFTIGLYLAFQMLHSK